MARKEMKNISVKKARIVKELQKHGNKSKACEKAGISKRAMYYWFSKDPIFLQNSQLAMAAFYSP